MLQVAILFPSLSMRTVLSFGLSTLRLLEDNFSFVFGEIIQAF